MLWKACSGFAVVVLTQTEGCGYCEKCIARTLTSRQRKRRTAWRNMVYGVRDGKTGLKRGNGVGFLTAQEWKL